MREFATLDEAKEWALLHANGRRVKVTVGQEMYWLEVKDPTANLRRTFIQKERADRLWRFLGWGVGLAWVMAILWLVAG